jgi:DNA-binding transcriptional regulator YiaG
MTTPAKPKTTTTPIAQKTANAKSTAASASAKKVAGKTVAQASASKTEKPAKKVKPPKVKMVRDSYSMPESDYAKLIELKKKCISAGVKIKKSELMRAGLLSLYKLSDAALLKEVEKVATPKDQTK